MTPPIPRRLLDSDAAVRVPVADGGLGGRYGDPVELRHVRFEPSDAADRADWQTRGGVRGTLFIDAANTEGAFAVPVSALVSVDGGQEAAVTACDEIRAMGRVHHWEVALG